MIEILQYYMIIVFYIYFYLYFISSIFFPPTKKTLKKQQLVPLGNGSQFQPRELYPQMPPPPNIPPPPVPQLEPLYAYPSSIYGTLPRGPPRPLERPGLPTIFQVHHPQSEFTNSPNHQSEDHIQDSDESDESAIESAKRQKQRLAVINYATFRQNISAEAAAAALRRAEITAHMARYWSDEDLSGQMPTLRYHSYIT